MLADIIRGYISEFQCANGLGQLGFERSDVDRLTAAAKNSMSAIQICPRDDISDAIAKIYEDSMTIY